MKDEELLSDYVDGRLAAGARASLEARLNAEPALARRARVLKAMKFALSGAAPAMPADLKTELKRRARAHAPRRGSSWLDDLRAALWAPWAYGAGAAAFAAAALTVVLLHHPSATSPVTRFSPAPVAAFSDPAAAEGLKNLWREDNGGDGDEG